jgi:hypothetical protein
MVTNGNQVGNHGQHPSLYMVYAPIGVAVLCIAPHTATPQLKHRCRLRSLVKGEGQGVGCVLGVQTQLACALHIHTPMPGDTYVKHEVGDTGGFVLVASRHARFYLGRHTFGISLMLLYMLENASLTPLQGSYVRSTCTNTYLRSQTSPYWRLEHHARHMWSQGNSGISEVRAAQFEGPLL